MEYIPSLPGIDVRCGSLACDNSFLVHMDQEDDATNHILLVMFLSQQTEVHRNQIHPSLKNGHQPKPFLS
ncbi:hypothetical protein VNO80_09158 [Phaseolus coccineus]|uniref:Uncharacterized protein n=1 Tax=Phaseolus coccineus TaxID=3886 RepID=A0AAN9NB35_PHACN